MKVINCTQAILIQPFVAEVGRQGQITKRYQLNSSTLAVHGLYGNVVGEGTVVFVQGLDMPPDWQGSRQVVLRIDHRTLKLEGRGTIAIEVSEGATTEQKVWAKERSGGRGLPAVWIEDVGNNQLMINHRTLTSWVGEPQVRLDEWALFVDSTKRPYVGKLVFNRSTTVLASQPLPTSYFGDERAGDVAKNILYVQGRRHGTISKTFGVHGSEKNANVNVHPWQPNASSKGEDILVWNTSSQAAVRFIPMHGIALYALHYDVVMDRLRAVVAKPMSSSEVSEFELVEVDTTDGTLHPLRNYSVPSPLMFQSFTASSHAFDQITGTLALLFVEPTHSSDWSGGDPKTTWVLTLQTRDVAHKGQLHKVAILSAAVECSSLEAETRLYRPALSYIPEPDRTMYFV